MNERINNRERLGWLALLAFLLFFGGLFLIGNSTPDTSDSALKVAHFYREHRNAQIEAAILAGLAGLALMLFAVPLYRTLRRANPDDGAWPLMASLAITAAATSLLLAAGVHLALAESAKDVSVQGVAAINAVDGTSFIAMFGTVAITVLAVGVASWQSRALPRWVCVVGFVLALASVTPVAFFAATLGMLWLGAVGVVMAVRGLPSINDRAVPTTAQATSG